MENEPAETALNAPLVSIPSPIILRYYWLLVTLVFGITDVYASSYRKKTNSLVYSPEELDQLDAAGLPEAKTKDQLDAIMNLFHAAVHEPDVVCCVCDQFLRISESKLVTDQSHVNVHEQYPIRFPFRCRDDVDVGCNPFRK